MSRRGGIHPQDSGVDEHLQLSAFQGKFDVPEFIGNLSEKLIVQSKADPGPFDPKPFIRTFEAAVGKLIAVRRDVQAKSEQMEKSVRVSEREYSRKMTELSRGFETVGNSFAGMESRMNEVSSTAVRIGEQLETVHIERERAQAAYDILDFYNQLAKNDVAKLDAIRKEGKPGRRKVAVLLRRLSTVAKDVDLPSADKTRENIERYCEKFEKDMLNLFDRSYRKGDPKMMHHCAQTLLDFNGGTSCVQVYVNQHDFFINSVEKKKTFEDGALWDFLPDPDANAPKIENGLTDLFEEIRSTVDTEAQIVKAVFPNPPVVMQVFLQRVFAQSVRIQQNVEVLLHRGSSISDLAYLRILQLVHTQTSALVDDLKQYELPATTAHTTFEAAEPRSSVAPAAATSPISAILETAMDELFVPYIEGQRYLERESKSLAALYSDLLTAFTRYHERAQKGKASSVFDRVVNQLSAAATTTPGGVTTTTSTAASVLLRFGGVQQAHPNPTDHLIKDDDGDLQVDTAERMLKWHAEAIGRCVELTPTNDVPKHTFALLRVLAEALGTSYVEMAIESAQIRLDTADTRAEPNLHLLVVLKQVDLICHLWQHYVNTALLPLASSAVTIRREMVVFNNQTVSRLEGGVNHLLQKGTDAIIAYLTLQLSKQKRTDFNPRNDDLAFAQVNTEPCEACCNLLRKVRDAAKNGLSGKNLEILLTEIGMAFHGLILEHLRKFPVNETGGFMLAKDIKSYQDTISSFGIAALTERFEFVRQLGNIFLVQPTILKSYITEGYLGRIDPTLLKPYLSMRSDWNQVGKSFDDTYGDAGVGSETSRLGRLGGMMKEFEGLRLGEGLTLPAMPSGFPVAFALRG